MIANGLETLFILFSAGLACFLACGLALRLLPPDFLAAKQTSRSNHAGNPRQLGGLALVPSTFVAAAITLMVSSIWQAPANLTAMALAMAFLLGLADDWKGIAIGPRLLFQLIIAAGLVFSALPVGTGFTSVILVIIAVIAATYWINAVNFMDGLDWLLVSGLTAPLIFHAMVLAHAGSVTGLALLALGAAGSLLGFGFWNRPPARLFLGDSGSLFLGGLPAADILQVSARVGILVALTPFLFFLADTASTIAIRLLAGENIFRAHSRHAYQQAHRNGLSAVTIAIRIALLTLFLVALGGLMLPATGGISGLLFALACVTTALFILHLRTHRK